MGWCIRPRTRRRGSSWPSRRSGWIRECRDTPPRGDPQAGAPPSIIRLLSPVLPGYTGVTTTLRPSPALGGDKCAPSTPAPHRRGMGHLHGIRNVGDSPQGGSALPAPPPPPASTAVCFFPAGRPRGSRALPSGRSPCSKSSSTLTSSGEAGEGAGKWARPGPPGGRALTGGAWPGCWTSCTVRRNCTWCSSSSART